MPAWIPSREEVEEQLTWPWPRVKGFAKVFGTCAGLILGVVLAIILLALVS